MDAALLSPDEDHDPAFANALPTNNREQHKESPNYDATYLYYSLIAFVVSFVVIFFLFNALYCKDYYCREGIRIPCESPNSNKCNVPFHCSINIGNQTIIQNPVWNCQVYIWVPLGIHLFFYQIFVFFLRQAYKEYLTNYDISYDTSDKFLYRQQDSIKSVIFLMHLHILSVLFLLIAYLIHITKLLIEKILKKTAKRDAELYSEL